jgi:hypothetical protein
MTICLNQYSPSQLDLKTLRVIERRRRAVVITLQRDQFGVYVPCLFDKEGLPIWSEVVAVIERTQKVCDIP